MLASVGLVTAIHFPPEIGTGRRCCVGNPDGANIDEMICIARFTAQVPSKCLSSEVITG